MYNVLSYIVVLILTFIFTYIFNVKETYVFFFIILLIPVFDFIYFMYCRNKLEIRIDSYDKKVEKGEECNICINLKNKGIMPIEFFTYKINLENKFISNDFLIENRSLGSKKSDFRKFNVIPVHIGLGRVKINNIKIRSLFGLFQKTYDYELTAEINVLPNLHVIENDEKLVEYDVSDDGDDFEEVSKKTGDPGYEYRSYIPGDPLTKVNWKLSVKKDELMIRKDEIFTKIKKVVILDPYLNDYEDYDNISDYLIEGAFSITNELFLDDIDVDLYFMNNDKWNIFQVNTKNDINIIKDELSKYEFTSNKRRFSSLSINDKDKVGIVLVSTNKDMELSDFCEYNDYNGNNVTVITNNRRRLFDNQLLLTADFILESM